jgi:hypothetical protein
MRFMTISVARIIGTLGMATIAAGAASTHCGDNSTSSASAGASAPTPLSEATATAGLGLPADFPLAPGLSACVPIVINHEVICDWHGVDTRAVYDFYHDALPKAGYTLVGGARDMMDFSAPHKPGQLSFKKGKVTGAVLVIDNDLKIEVITPP